MIDVETIIKYIGIFAPLITATIPIITVILSRTLRDNIYEIKRRQIVRSIFSCNEFRKFLNLDEQDKKDYKYFKTFLILLVLEYFLISALGIAKIVPSSIFGLMLLILTLGLLVTSSINILFLIFLTILCFKQAEYLSKIYQYWRIIFYSVIAIGMVSSYFTFYAEGKFELYIISILVFFISIITDMLPNKESRKLFIKRIRDKLSSDTKKSPNFIIHTSVTSISGKIKNPYAKEFLVLNNGKNDIMIPWEEIKVVKC